MAKKIFMFLKKKSIFGHFCDFGKITKTTKNHFFLLKGGKFYLGQMWQFLFNKLSMKIDILRTFWPSKLKEGQFLAKKKWKKWLFYFFIESKSIENKKILFPQMIKVCQKKFPPFKRKNWFLAVFVIFPKSQKRPKIYFSLEKWKFFGTPLSFEETVLFHLEQFSWG